MNMEIIEVPPPKAINHQPLAQSLGLAKGLRAERNDRQFRCANCSLMVAKGETMVWVSDGSRMGDPLWAIEERERANAYNGSGSAWCLDCARKLSRGGVIGKVTGGWAFHPLAVIAVFSAPWLFFLLWGVSSR